MARLSNSERNLIIVQGFVFFASSLASIFVTVFLFQHSDLKTTLLFKLVSLSTLLFFYVVSGWTLKKIQSGLVIKLTLLSAALFYFLLFVLRDKAVNFIIPLALLDGFGAGNYWAAFNFNQYLFTRKRKRIKYFGSLTAVINFTQAIAPLIGGLVISLGKSHSLFNRDAGYTVLFFLVFVLWMVSIVVIGKLPRHEMFLFSFSDLIKHQRSKRWKLVLWQNAFLGLYDISLGTISSILIYIIVKQELILGITRTALYLLGAIGSLLAIRTLKRKSGSYWIGSFGLASGIGLFAFNQNLFGLLFFVIITGITSPFLNTWLSTINLQAIDDEPKHWKQKYHLLIERDIALGIPRIISFLFLYFFIQGGDQVQLAKDWLYLLPILPIVIGLLLKKYQAIKVLD